MQTREVGKSRSLNRYAPHNRRRNICSIVGLDRRIDFHAEPECESMRLLLQELAGLRALEHSVVRAL
jgi:hypothetical protein